MGTVVDELAEQRLDHGVGAVRLHQRWHHARQLALYSKHSEYNRGNERFSDISKATQRSERYLVKASLRESLVGEEEDRALEVEEVLHNSGDALGVTISEALLAVSIVVLLH